MRTKFGTKTRPKCSSENDKLTTRHTKTTHDSPQLPDKPNQNGQIYFEMNGRICKIEKRLFQSSGTAQIISSKSNISHSQRFQETQRRAGCVHCEVRARFVRRLHVWSVYVCSRCTHQHRMIAFGTVVLKNTETYLSSSSYIIGVAWNTNWVSDQCTRCCKFSALLADSRKRAASSVAHASDSVGVAWDFVSFTIHSTHHSLFQFLKLTREICLATQKTLDNSSKWIKKIMQ